MSDDDWLYKTNVLAPSVQATSGTLADLRAECARLRKELEAEKMQRKLVEAALEAAHLREMELRRLMPPHTPASPEPRFACPVQGDGDFAERFTP